MGIYEIIQRETERQRGRGEGKSEMLKDSNIQDWLQEEQSAKESEKTQPEGQETNQEGMVLDDSIKVG